MSFDSDFKHKQSLLSLIEIDIRGKETEYSNMSFKCDNRCTCREKTCYLVRYETLSKLASEAQAAFDNGRYEEVPAIVKKAADQIEVYESE